MASIIQQLAQKGHLGAKAVMDAFNPDQERDEHGRWTGGETASDLYSHNVAAAYHQSESSRLGLEAGKAHAAAAEAHASASRAFSSRNRNSAAEREYRTRMSSLARKASVSANKVG